MILSKKSMVLILISDLIASTFGMGIFSYFPRYLLNLNVDMVVIQLFVTLFIFTTVLFPPLIGRFSDKIQHRALLFKFGAAGICVSLFLLTTVISLILILVLLFIYGFFRAFERLKIVLYAELVENDSRFIAYDAAIIALGWFIGAFSTGIFVEMFGIEQYFFFLLIISLVNLVVILFIKEDRSIILERSNNNNESLEVNNLIEQKEINPISRTIYPSLYFRNFATRPIMAILAIIMFIHISSDTQIGFLIGINFLIQFFLNILLGHAVKDNEERLKWIMAIGYAFSVITIFGWIIATDFWSFLFFQITVSLSYAMFYTATLIYVNKHTTPQNKGKYVGYMQMSSQMGAFTGGLAFSLLLIIYGDYYAAMWFMIAFPVISTLIIIFKFESKKE